MKPIWRWAIAVVGLTHLQQVDDREIKSLAFKSGTIVVGPAQSISSNVTDVVMNDDGTAIVFGRRVFESIESTSDKPRKVEVVYQDLKTGKSSILMPATDEDSIRFGTRFGFVNQSKTLVYYVDPGPWIPFSPCPSCDRSAYTDTKRTAAIYRFSTGSKYAELVGREALGPGEDISLSRLQDMPAITVSITRDHVRTEPPPTPAVQSTQEEVLVPETGGALRVQIPVPFYRMYAWMWDKQANALVLNGCSRLDDHFQVVDDLVVTISLRDGKVMIGKAKPEPPRPLFSGNLTSGDGLVPDGIDFISNWPDPIVYSPRSGQWSEQELEQPFTLRWDTRRTYKSQNLQPLWMTWTGKASTETLQLSRDVDEYTFSQNGRSLATLTDGNLSVRRIEVRRGK